MYCAGFLIAAMSGLSLLGTANEPQFNEARKTFGICPLPTVTTAAGVQAFKNWAQKHPEAWGIVAYPGVVFALKETWPCK
jgi:Rap1a immunity proteins